MDELENQTEAALPYPVQRFVVGTVAGPAAERGKTELATLWAGQSVNLCRFTDAAELMAELIDGTDAYFAKFASRESSRVELLGTGGSGAPFPYLFY